jgi:hypothetical protein
VLSGSQALRSPTAYLEQRQKNLDLLQNRMVAAQRSVIARKQQRFVGLTAKLDAMSPLKVLSRGYAMAQKGNQVLRSVQQSQPGDTVTVTFSDGSLTATVTEVKENFLKRLYEATAKEIAWEESDVAQALRDLREHVDWLPVGVDGDVVAQRIDAVMERMAGKRVMYGAYHGDFTPWNMFVEGGELFVFDWEYAGWTYPMGLDRYHFWMQSAVFEKHWGVEELKRYMGSDEGKWIDGEMLEMYVLDVMSKYVMREGGKVKELGMFGVWCGMMDIIVP